MSVRRDSPVPASSAHHSLCSVLVSLPSAPRTWALEDRHLGPGLPVDSHFYRIWRNLHITEWCFCKIFLGFHHMVYCSFPWILFCLVGKTWFCIQHSLTSEGWHLTPISDRWVIIGREVVHLLVEVNQCCDVCTIDPTAECILIWLFSLQVFPSFSMAQLNPFWRPVLWISTESLKWKKELYLIILCVPGTVLGTLCHFNYFSPFSFLPVAQIPWRHPCLLSVIPRLQSISTSCQLWASPSRLAPVLSCSPAASPGLGACGSLLLPPLLVVLPSMLSTATRTALSIRNSGRVSAQTPPTASISLRVKS